VAPFAAHRRRPGDRELDGRGAHCRGDARRPSPQASPRAAARDSFRRDRTAFV